MYSSRLKCWFFILEALNALGTTYYFYYLYFFTEKEHGFSKIQNLLLAAAIGLTYGVGSMLGGRFAQRRGYFTALRVGYGLMLCANGIGAFVPGLATQLPLMFAAAIGMAFTWPALEALVSEGEPRHRLQRNVGIYNFVWGGFGALAYFSGGALISVWTFKAMFLVPAAIHLVQLMLGLVLERAAGRERRASRATSPAEGQGASLDSRERLRAPVDAPGFLKMAWLANPFAYLAINTVVAVIPTLAARLELSVKWAGIFCSVWLFVRTGSFVALWLWPGWHYRFRWLVGAYAMMTLSFGAMLLVPNLWVIGAAQVAFGLALGLIYYSSLYYSMDVGETKGEHGGFHEAMIGAGSCAGPAVGAAVQHFYPQSPNSSTWAVGTLMCGGLVALLCVRLFRSAPAASPLPPAPG